MKLNREIKYITQYNGGSDLCRELGYKLPDHKCLTQPSIVVIEHEGVYYIVKSCWEIEGDPCNSGHKPVNPYDLEFIEYTLHEVRSECNPRTHYRLPMGFIGQNVLVHMLPQALCHVCKDGDVIFKLDMYNIEDVRDYVAKQLSIDNLCFENLDNQHYILYANCCAIEFDVYYKVTI
jgi:hypothetical protein